MLYRTAGGRGRRLVGPLRHRPYPLSAGSLDGDAVRCGLCGFVSMTRGAVPRLRAQPRVPFGERRRVPGRRAGPASLDGWGGGRPPPPGARPAVADRTRLGHRRRDGGGRSGFLLLHGELRRRRRSPSSPGDRARRPRGTLPPLDVVVARFTVELHRRFPRPPCWPGRRAWSTAGTGTSRAGDGAGSGLMLPASGLESTGDVVAGGSGCGPAALHAPDHPGRRGSPADCIFGGSVMTSRAGRRRDRHAAAARAVPPLPRPRARPCRADCRQA